MNRQQLVEFLGGGPRTIHFMGIGGAGMSGLAKILLEQGHLVTGCDLSANGETCRLRQLGVRVEQGHCPSHIKRDTQLVVRSSAIHDPNPELQAALAEEIPVVRRGELLSALLNHQNNIAVAGTHGKTTTSAMLAHILTRSESAPSFCIGAHIPALGTNAQNGAGRHFVVEADESDGTLIGFTPDYAICLNIEPEHLDYHKSMENLRDTFDMFLSSTLRRVFYCADCETCIQLATKQRDTISFGLSPAADYRAVNIRHTTWGSRLTVCCRDQEICEVQLQVPGEQNIVNALAAFAVADELEVPVPTIAGALGDFSGARRRFERKFEGREIVVADDYGHHPTEIRTTLTAARTLGFSRILLAFQPHRYSRTESLQAEFTTAFAGVDRLYLTDIYGAGEKPIAGLTGESLVRAVRKTGQKNVVYEPDLRRLAERLVQETQSGDLVLTMGAGDIDKVSEAVATLLQARGPYITAPPDQREAVISDLRTLLSGKTTVKQDEPMAKHTSLRVGGPAEFWVEPGNENDLARLLHYAHAREIPVTVIGRGTNLLVRDGGIEGFVIRLDGAEFTRVTVRDERVIARAGGRLRQVVNSARRNELGGLEFLEGIPGSVGGALRMNAGAMGRQTFEVLDRVRYVSLAGEIYESEARVMPVSYRSCPVFASHVALEATFRGEKTKRSLIEKTLRLFEKQRWANQPAKPSAGCIFKNPDPITAGRLIEELGLKGEKIGRAEVSDTHGNFIVTSKGANATDVLALIRRIRQRALDERGIELETEVTILGRESNGNGNGR